MNCIAEIHCISDSESNHKCITFQTRNQITNALHVRQGIKTQIHCISDSESNHKCNEYQTVNHTTNALQFRQGIKPQMHCILDRESNHKQTGNQTTNALHFRQGIKPQLNCISYSKSNHKCIAFQTGNHTTKVLQITYFTDDDNENNVTKKLHTKHDVQTNKLIPYYNLFIKPRTVCTMQDTKKR